MKPKAYSYLRFSSDQQAQGDSFRRQMDLAKQYAKEHDLELDDELTFHDLGVSAYRGRNAETGRLREFLEAVRAGLVPKGSYLLVESLDRISRQTARKALRVLEEIVEEGITVVTMTDRREYTAEGLDQDPLSLVLSILTFIRAHEESLTKSRRLKAVWENRRKRARNGEIVTSSTPGWLDIVDGKFVVDEEKAEVVRWCFAEAARGVGYNGIVKSLNRRGVKPFRRGKIWHYGYLADLLANPAVIGTYVPHTTTYDENGRKVRVAQEPVEGYYPAIVEPEVFAAVQALRDSSSPQRGRHAGKPVRNLFAGILRCGRCGGAATLKSGPVYYLVCTAAKNGAGCEYEGVRWEDAEAFFLKRAEELIAEAPAAAGGSLEQEIAEVQRELWGADETIENLLTAIERQPSEALQLRLAKVETFRERMREKHMDLLARAENITGPLVRRRLEDLAAALREEPLDRTRANALMRQVFDKVVIDFEAKELVLHWRHGGESRVEYSTEAYGFA